LRPPPSPRKIGAVFASSPVSTTLIRKPCRCRPRRGRPQRRRPEAAANLPRKLGGSKVKVARYSPPNRALHKPPALKPRDLTNSWQK
jgi:hypothetical protein